jgi:hypothetical protein
MTHIYCDILGVLKLFENEKKTREKFFRSIPSVRSELYRNIVFPNSEKFLPVEWTDGTIYLIPGNQSLYLYRGQVHDYPTCLPEIYRDNPTDVDLFAARLKQIEFEIVLKEHPAVQDILNAGFHISFTGLAQHYELATNYLDLTSDPYVAAFFAVCKYCESEQRYLPIAGQDKPGVFMKTLSLVYSNPSDIIKFRPIGLQPFPRPGSQKAYAVSLDKGESFSSHKMLFWHSKKVSQHIYDLFEGGDKLCPPDPIKRKADEIADAVVFSQQTIDEISSRYSFPHEPNFYLEQLNFEISNTCNFEFTLDELNQFKEDWEEIGKQEFNNQIGPTYLTY